MSAEITKLTVASILLLLAVGPTPWLHTIKYKLQAIDFPYDCRVAKHPKVGKG